MTNNILEETQWLVVTSLTLGNFLKIDSHSSHTPKVWHTSTFSRREIYAYICAPASPQWVVEQLRGIDTHTHTHIYIYTQTKHKGKPTSKSKSKSDFSFLDSKVTFFFFKLGRERNFFTFFSLWIGQVDSVEHVLLRQSINSEASQFGRSEFKGKR